MASVMAAGTWWTVGPHSLAVAEDEVIQATAGTFYFQMEPLIVNVSSGTRQPRFLKVTPVVVTQHQEVFGKMKTIEPVMRNALLSLYSQADINDLLSDDGFENLRALSLDELKDIVGRHTGMLSVNDVLFTEYVVQ